MSYRRLPIFALVVVVLATGTATRTDAAELSRRDRMLRLLNKARRNHDLPILRLNRELSALAWTHSKRMARRNRVFHTKDLYSAVRSYSPSCWGENVGMAARLYRVRTLWMHSAGHRANILKQRFRRIGIGVVKARGGVWVTAIFYGG
jgi:uncharacterized protein YkwD